MGDQRAVDPMTRGGPLLAVSSQNPNLFPGQIRTLSYFLNSQGSGGSTSKGDHGVKTQRKWEISAQNEGPGGRPWLVAGSVG